MDIITISFNLPCSGCDIAEKSTTKQRTSEVDQNLGPGMGQASNLWQGLTVNKFPVLLSGGN